MHAHRFQHPIHGTSDIGPAFNLDSAGKGQRVNIEVAVLDNLL